MRGRLIGVVSNRIAPRIAQGAARSLGARQATLAAALVLSTSGVYLKAQAPSPPAAVMYGERCASCHGTDAKGLVGPNLTRLWANGATDDRVLQIIKAGVPGSMPPSVAPDAEIRAVVAHLKTLAASATAPAGAFAGNDARVTVVTREGQRTTGERLGEDAFSIQIVTAAGRLVAFNKAETLEIATADTAAPAAGVSDRGGVAPPVTIADHLNGLNVPAQWISYHGDYTGQRHSPLTSITPENVPRLAAEWTYQTGTLTRGRGFEATPLLADGVLYVTGPNNLAWALDARTGRLFWSYRRNLPPDLTYGAAAPVNRGFGMLGDRLFMVTLDAHLLALSRTTGRVLWDVTLADYKIGYAATLAPLIVDGKVIVGISGGEYPTRGFLDAYDPATGARAWRFYSVPAKGEPGSESWPQDTDAITRGGGGMWMTGSYDPALNILFWGTGNPNPDYWGTSREGDNLYTNSLVAIDASNGLLKWHYQFTPHDTHDWDSNQIPVLADLTLNGVRRSVVMMANRNGFFYVLDRKTGEVLLARPFTATTWAREIGTDGRPIVLNDGSTSCLPDFWGGTNFNPPSFDAALGLFFVVARETCAIYIPSEPHFAPGRRSEGGFLDVDRENSSGALRAIDASTGEVRWQFPYPSPSMAGVLSTASGLVFAGDNEGNFMAFDSRTGKNLWRYVTGAPIWGAAAITYMLDGRQHVVIASGATLVSFAIPAP